MSASKSYGCWVCYTDKHQHVDCPKIKSGEWQREFDAKFKVNE